MGASTLAVAYLAAAVLFILGLKGLASPRTARAGNAYAMAGMVLAALVTLASPQVGEYGWIVAGVAIGGGIGAVLARRVKMTDMPQLVAILHSFVGLAAVLVGFANYLGPEVQMEGAERAIHEVEIYLGILIGAVAIALDAVCLAAVEWAVDPAPPSLRPEHPAVARVRARIDAAPGRPWTLSELAAGTGLGPKHLCTRFGREVGQTPHQYLLAARIEGVKRALVESDLAIAALAQDFGFASSQHLSRVFARRVGLAPQRFRTTHREVPGPTPR